MEEPCTAVPVERVDTRKKELRMEQASGVLWALQIIVGPLVLAGALAYGTFRYRRRSRLGELNSTREMVMIAVPVVLAVVLLTALMMIPGSQ
jgi:uncharacterized membrane protein YidH (DUF202 family)